MMLKAVVLPRFMRQRARERRETVRIAGSGREWVVEILERRGERGRPVSRANAQTVGVLQFKGIFNL